MPRSPAVVQLPSVPAWAGQLGGGRLATATVADAVDHSAAELSAAVAAAYADVLSRSAHPARFWNGLPDINGPVDDRQSRYMAFNAGRLVAFDRWPAATSATASAVGHAGRDLTVCCLSFDRPPTPIDNPRQTPPHRYSARYGPRPPCFARAAVVGPHLFVGGTASIRGEATVHAHPAGQVGETLLNLSAVLAAAGDRHVLTAVRVYCPPSVGPAEVAPLLPDGWAVEWVSAELCRPDLLVEIEAFGRERP